MSSAAEQAVEWFVRMDAQALSNDERAAFEAWRAVPANAKAFEQVERAWSDLEGARPATGVANSRIRGGWRSLRIAASIAAGVVLMLWGPELRLRVLADERTAIGEIRTVKLPDGSVATLNTDSALAVDFTSQSRAVRILEGEAVFEVVPDATRPFVVEAAGGTTRALGTTFGVRTLSSGAGVTGIEHQVEVTYPKARGASDAPTRVRIGPGRQVRYDSKDGMSAITAAPALSDAWRRGRLVVENRPLAEVVDELNRYSQRHIQLWGSGLGELRVNGVFPVSDVDTSIRALEHSLGIKTTRITDYVVILTR